MWQSCSFSHIAGLSGWQSCSFSHIAGLSGWQSCSPQHRYSPTSVKTELPSTRVGPPTRRQRCRAMDLLYFRPSQFAIRTLSGESYYSTALHCFEKKFRLLRNVLQKSFVTCMTTYIKMQYLFYCYVARTFVELCDGSF